MKDCNTDIFKNFNIFFLNNFLALSISIIFAYDIVICIFLFAQSHFKRKNIRTIKTKFYITKNILLPFTLVEIIYIVRKLSVNFLYIL